MDNTITTSTMESLQVDDAKIEFELRGQGEPVLMIAPSVIGDGLAYPLFGRPELAAKHLLIHYRRRGYGGSTRGSVPLAVPRQAADAAALLKHLGISSSHVTGHSFGGSIALQLALDAPGLVHSLALLEPDLPSVQSGQARLQALFAPVMSAYRQGEKRKALDLMGDAIFGPGWQAIVEREIPGGIEQAVRDLDTFMLEQPAIQGFQFGAEQAAKINLPVLSVLGTNTSPFMKSGRSLIHTWFPQAEDLDVHGTHLLQMADPKSVATGLAEFFARHPIK